MKVRIQEFSVKKPAGVPCLIKNCNFSYWYIFAVLFTPLRPVFRGVPNSTDE
jgi:hypothetical protein